MLIHTTKHNKYNGSVAIELALVMTFILVPECLAVYGNIGCNGNPLVSGLTKSNISINAPIIPGIKVVTVSVINYKATLITSLFKPFNFNNISVSMRQQES